MGSDEGSILGEITLGGGQVDIGSPDRCSSRAVQAINFPTLTVETLYKRITSVIRRGGNEIQDELFKQHGKKVCVSTQGWEILHANKENQDEEHCLNVG
jgi:hypothetical protein